MTGMDGFEEKLNSILSSPEDMKKIMELAKNLSGGNKSADPPKGGKSAPSSPLPDLDPRLIQLLLRVKKGMSEDDGKTKLLCCLKPYLREDRREKVDRAIRIARAAEIARRALGELGGGDGDLF